MNKKKILAISGSTRAHSTNSNYIKAITDLYHDQLEVTVYKGLSTLPHFNPDDDHDAVSGNVTLFRNQLREADGVLICTPEYALGIPGTLKNALDWTVSSASFSHKPVALITAASMGEKAHESLLGTLRIIEANVTDQLQLHIPFARTKISEEGKITDEKTLGEVKKVVDAFIFEMK